MPNRYARVYIEHIAAVFYDLPEGRPRVKGQVRHRSGQDGVGKKRPSYSRALGRSAHVRTGGTQLDSFRLVLQTYRDLAMQTHLRLERETW